MQVHLRAQGSGILGAGPPLLGSARHPGVGQEQGAFHRHVLQRDQCSCGDAGNGEGDANSFGRRQIVAGCSAGLYGSAHGQGMLPKPPRAPLGPGGCLLMLAASYRQLRKTGMRMKASCRS